MLGALGCSCVLKGAPIRFTMKAAKGTTVRRPVGCEMHRAEYTSALRFVFWLCWSLVAELGIFSCSMWDLVP